MELNNKELYTADQLNYLSDGQLINVLKKYWNIKENEPIQVIGKLKYISPNHYRIFEVKKASDSIPIEYPLLNINERLTIKKGGIYTPVNYLSKPFERMVISGEVVTIITELVLSSQKERDKHNLPCAVMSLDSSIKVLHEIAYDKFFIKSNDTNYIKDGILEYIKEKNKVSLLKEYNNTKEKLKEKLKKDKEHLIKYENILKEDISSSKVKIDNIQKEIDQKQLEAEKIIDSFQVKIKKEESIFNNKKNQYEKSQIKLKDKIDENITKSKETLAVLKNKYNEKIKKIKNKKIESTKLDMKILTLKEELKNKEDIMAQKLEKLREFIKEKANTLLDLEFIDQEEYDNLLMQNKDNQSDEKFVDFENDLQKDKQKAISHIQAYLFEQDIVYPRYILEDFLALIQTNDLIILAGESGSGKTNLIKSFAKAIGGKSFIIPVKPNWTSSEDLLGYYNPLEKKYLSTPFLEALLEAKDNPNIPYFICLDEMNLARVEYYFADFSSLLEERGEQPEIKLYSEDESAHILSEFKNVMDTIEHTKEKYKKKNIINFIQLLQDEEINKELTRIFGFSDKDSLIKYHTDLRRMLSGILNTPSSITFPKNVRIIGAINIDETTHYLSPKILDRAHIMKFDSPLLQNWDTIATEIDNVENKELKIKFKIEDLGTRKAYPSFDRDNEFCKIIVDMTKNYFSPLGIEVGLRTIRQGLNYKQIFIEQNSNQELVINNFIIHKILPKMTFDGSKQVGEETKKDLLTRMKENLKEYINQDLAKLYSIDAITELEDIIKTSESNEGIVNYWA
jgi:hypothetical protein